MSTEVVLDDRSLTERYVALWNEHDGEARRHVTPSIVVHGYDELEACVARSVQRWIVEEGYHFRGR